MRGMTTTIYDDDYISLLINVDLLFAPHSMEMEVCNRGSRADNLPVESLRLGMDVASGGSFGKSNISRSIVGKLWRNSARKAWNGTRFDVGLTVQIWDDNPLAGKASILVSTSKWV